MKASDIIMQLQVVLPTLTNDFSEQIVLNSVTPTGTTALAVTATDHPFVVGDVVNISDTVAPVAITSISRTGTVATVTTATNHDITENDLTTEVTISGTTEAIFNGTFPLLSANNRLTFQFTATESGPPTATGGLLEDPPGAFGYNGLKTITAIPNLTSFQYELPVALTVAAGPGGVVHSSIQITGALNEERAREMYTAQAGSDSLWGFVSLGDTTASKDRNSRNDAVTSATPGGDRRQQIFQNFSVFVFKPAPDDLSARAARDQMEDVMLNLFQSLMYWKAPSGLSDTGNMGVTFNDHGFLSYDTATYVHEFRFQLLSNITQNDTIAPDFNVAFRDIDLTIGTNLGPEKLTATIDLDDDPL